MRLFISAGEPSGDLHGANLIRSLQKFHPGIEFHGLGGERMAEAGCRLVFPLCELAVIGFFEVLTSLPKFIRVLNLADRWLREHRPDAVVLIDFPGFHWWLARRAKALGIPVIYFVPPQIWGWASWRVNKMRRLVNLVLCNLPFEADWYRERRVPCRYVGHPYFDELRGQKLDDRFLAEQRAREGTIVTILPGSRQVELDHNLESQLRAAERIHAARPETRFLVACLKEKHRLQVEKMLAGRQLPIEPHAGRTPECIELAHSCLSVSGSVSLELLWRGKPSVVVYRHQRLLVAVAHVLKQCRYITLVNLLADRELFPEFFSHRCQAKEMSDAIIHWLNTPADHDAVRNELAELRGRVAESGACDRAAAAVVEMATARRSLAA